VIGDARRHCGGALDRLAGLVGDRKRLVDARKVVVRVVEADRVSQILDLFEKALVRRVKRRIPIRIVRFWRST
jgi:hypothetical protein